MKRTPNPKVAIETQSQEILRLNLNNGREGEIIDNLNKREDIFNMNKPKETTEDTLKTDSTNEAVESVVDENTKSEKKIRWDALAIEQITDSMDMLLDAGLTMEDIKRKNPKHYDTYLRIQSGENVAKGSRTETLLSKFMVTHPEHPLSKFVLEHSASFDFPEMDAIIRINGAKKPKEEVAKK